MGQDSQDLTPGTHFDSFLVIAPAAEGRGRRDYARGLLSPQWNMGFPLCGQSGSTAPGPTKEALKAKAQGW